ncbi:MAG: hypothetical protein ACFB8W_20340 [Elainellaceae cyanobacterium]
MKRVVRFLAIALLSGLLIIGTATGAVAQLFNLPTPPADSTPQTELQIQRHSGERAIDLPVPAFLVLQC